MRKIATALARHIASYRVVSGYIDIAREMCVRSDAGDANCDTSLGSAVQPPNVCQRGGPIVPHGTFRRGRRRGLSVNSTATRTGPRRHIRSRPNPSSTLFYRSVWTSSARRTEGQRDATCRTIVSGLCASQETRVDLIQHAQQVIGAAVLDDPTVNDAIDADARDRDCMAGQRRPRV